MPNNRHPSSKHDPRRELDRNYTGGEPTNASGSDVQDELDQETYQLQREYDADAPKSRH